MFNKQKIITLETEISKLRSTIALNQQCVSRAEGLLDENKDLKKEIKNLQSKLRQQCEADILWEAEKIKRGETPDMNVLNRLHALSLQDLAMQQRIGLSQPSALSGIFGRFI
jgi:hypothetical protein